jgi:hypothetical protein
MAYLKLPLLGLKTLCSLAKLCLNMKYLLCIHLSDQVPHFLNILKLGIENVDLGRSDYKELFRCNAE